MQEMKDFWTAFQFKNWGFQSKNNICDVGYYHQNAIVEREIQTLTVGYITLLLHENIYCPEAMTKMLWPHKLRAL